MPSAASTESAEMADAAAVPFFPSSVTASPLMVIVEPIPKVSVELLKAEVT